jgi:hypothetical protein
MFHEQEVRDDDGLLHVTDHGHVKRKDDIKEEMFDDQYPIAADCAVNQGVSNNT